MKLILQNKNWYAEISPEHGGNIDRLRYGGKDVYRPGDWEAEPCLQGAPMLLPANRTYQGRFSFEGKCYQLPVNEPANDANLHGSVYLREFAVTKADEREVQLVYENRGEAYPFPFKIEVTYAAGEEFLQQYTITNTGDTAMPLTFALHTTFIEPAEFTAPIERRQQKDAHHIPTGQYVSLNEQEQRYRTGSPSRDVIISGYYRSAGQIARIGGFTYEVSPKFDHWVLFNGQGKSGFLCVEPQCGAVNGLNMEDGHTVLQPKEQIIFWTKLKA